MKSPPESEEALLVGARMLAGRRLGELAAQLGVPLPANGRAAKGWTGQLIERALGADAGNLPLPDFQLLGVELKTIPVDNQGRPQESTYVCRAPGAPQPGSEWEASTVRIKLRRVLWLPIEAATGATMSTRRLGWAFLWSPSPKAEKILREDWEELHDLLCLGQHASISARLGTYLQLRPKGADARETGKGFDEEGAAARVPPMGFYLRAAFTRLVLAESLA